MDGVWNFIKINLRALWDELLFYIHAHLDKTSKIYTIV